MKTSLLSLLMVVLIFADACTRGTTTDEPPLTAQAATCANFMKGKTQMNLKQVLTCAALICATYPTACQPPAPKPPTPDAGTGGMAGTGGASATGGGSSLSPRAKCTAAKTNDPSVQNVARQTGKSVSSLVDTICSDPTILEGYSR